MNKKNNNNEILDKRKNEDKISEKIKTLNFLKAFNAPTIALGLCGIAFSAIFYRFNPSDIAFAKELMNLSFFLEAFAIPYAATTTIITKKYVSKHVVEEKYSIDLFNETMSKEKELSDEMVDSYVLLNSKNIDKTATTNINYSNNNFIEETPMHKVKQLKK